VTSTHLSTRPPSNNPSPTEPGATRVSPRRLLALAAIAGLVALAVGVPFAQRERGPAPAPDPASLVPSIPAVTEQDLLPASLPGPAAPGSVQLVPGPFADAAAIDALVLQSDGSVTGTARVLRDVSELIEMNLFIGWYDADGALLAGRPLVLSQPDFTQAFQAGITDSLYNGVLPWQVEAPAEITPQVSSAVVRLVSVVNE